MNFEIKKALVTLELGDLVRIIETQESDLTLMELSFDERLEVLLATLVQERENRLISRLIKNSYIKYPQASIETLDYDSRDIAKSVIINIANMGFMSTATNLIITGPTGSGKTYLASALGIEACKKEYRTLYIRMPDLMRNFENLKDNLREQTKYRKRIGNYPLLIIDEWLLYPLKETEARDLLEIMERRYRKGSTIFCSQFDIPGWQSKIGDQVMADAICDRIVHNAYSVVVECKESMRKHTGISQGSTGASGT